MLLCSACKRINVPALICELPQVPDWWGSPPNQSEGRRGMLHLQDARQLPESAATCSLCAMIRDAMLRCDDKGTPLLTYSLVSTVQHESRDVSTWEDCLVNGPIYLRPKYGRVKSTFPEQVDVLNPLNITGFKVFMPVFDGIASCQIRVFASPNSPAAVSCDVGGRPSLPSSDCPEAYALINRWIRSCIAEHELCRKTLAGSVIDESAPPILPTRIIDVGPPGGHTGPRLIETQAKTGYYVALSHCWGPAQKRPPMTTQSNYHEHLAGISWMSLPKTYQDALTVTRKLGLRYIWIDSLCILQDSRSDWLFESKRMGTVYENAHLTISASHAPDSSHGCFLSRLQPLPSIELTHVTSNGASHGSVFATPMPSDYAPISPESGLLDTRAWATQEWLLSRRMVFYTSGCLVWSCKMITQRETGGSCHSTARNPRWKFIVEKYSARLLTNPTDRLIALEGLAIEMAKRRGNDTYWFGLWKNSMPDQLLWYCVEPAQRMRCPLAVPTWSWASSTHGVRFLDIQSAKNFSQIIRLHHEHGTLTIRGPLTKLQNILSPANPVHFKIREGAFALERYSAFVANVWKPLLPPTLTCTLCFHQKAIIGYGILDEQPTPSDSSIFCLTLMSKRGSRPPLDGTKGRRIKWQEDWVLLLRLKEPNRDAYERFGIGRLFRSGWTESDQILTEVSIH
ncbi:HET-domain-containing protein [Delitschia confertaspora ATCC 74209]|uniref:HET-domain-containing protein n=1 Tax=Delitschia confertaspora ATCC 74209 TaxID=1513339 RepID=A0A9P4MPC4_9PLEO|nr:HET-domain-containing protein [Delitschia confertaspora ATCC 74209]